MEKIPQSHQDLLADETKAFAFLATIMPDGTPQVSPVWFNSDDEYILINTAVGRLKDRNMSQHPDVAVTLLNPANPYRYLLVRGKVVEATQEGADKHIHALSHKYRGLDWDIPAGQVRVVYKIKPEHVFASQ